MGIFKKVFHQNHEIKVIHHEISVWNDELEGLKFMITILDRKGIPWHIMKSGRNGDRTTIKFDTNTKSEYEDIMAEVEEEIRKFYKGNYINVEVIEEEE